MKLRNVVSIVALLKIVFALHLGNFIEMYIP